MKTNRRNFILNSTFAIAGLWNADSKILETEKMHVSQASGIRKNVNRLGNSDPDLEAYRKAVSVMKSRDENDPRSWAFQAKIHMNHCPHNNWFILPWHRAYLKYFEEICRDASGKPDFNLPYWDWTEFPQLPSQFVLADDPLNNTTRRINGNATADIEFVGRAAMSRIMQLDSFEDFGSYRSGSLHETSASGLLEGSSHNYIHRFVGGHMVTMLSPLDPIFWLHHANIDRIWATWNDLGNSNPDDAGFKNTDLSNHFFDSQGNLVATKIGDFLDTKSLNYIYDTQVGQPLIAAVNNLPLLKFSQLTKAGIQNTKSIASFNPASFPILTNSEFKKGAEEALVQLASKTSKKEIKVSIGEIPIPPQQDFFVRVFLNCDYLDKNTPINDPHYVGSFTFFGAPHAGHQSGGHIDAALVNKLKFAFDITKTVEKVIGSTFTKDIIDKINVQLLPIPFDSKSKFTITPGSIEIAVADRTL